MYLYYKNLQIKLHSILIGIDKFCLIGSTLLQLTGRSQEDDFMGPKCQYGIVKTANILICQMKEDIIGRGKKSLHLKTVAVVAALNLSEKIEHLIHGWTLVSLHCLLQNIRIIRNSTVILIQLQ